MSESDSFIQEVTEEVRQDRMYALWKKWGPFVLIGVALIVGGAAFLSWLQVQEKAEAEALGASFVAAERGSIEDQRALADEVSDDTAVIADLGLAAAMAQNGDAAGAISLYRGIADRAGLDRAYADFARLQAARQEALTESPETVLPKLGALITEDGPYRLLALEFSATLRLATGDVEAAHADLNSIVLDPEATETLRLRAAQIIAISGGQLEDQEE